MLLMNDIIETDSTVGTHVSCYIILAMARLRMCGLCTEEE